MNKKSLLGSFVALLGLASVAQAESYELKSWSTQQYDVVENGLLVNSSTDALGNTVSRHTDGAGRTRKSVDALGKISTASYDANGNLLSSRDSNGNGQDCEFDARNRRTSCTDTAGATTSTTYDANNLVTSVTDAKNEVTSFQYDARNRRYATTDRLGNVVLNYFDANNNLTSIVDQESNTTAYTFDALNRQTEVRYQGHTEPAVVGDSDYDKIVTTYDALSRKVSVLNQKGETVTYAYDLASRLLTRSYSDNTVDTFTYDDASRLLTAHKGRYNNTIAFGYDNIGRLETYTQTVNGVAREITHSYDYANRHLTCTMPSDALITSLTHDWTDRNQLNSITATTAAGNKATSFVYDDGGRETSRTFANGLVQDRTYTTGDNTYATISMTAVDAANFAYGYDANKNVTSEARSTAFNGNDWAASFDKLDRLTSWNKTNGYTQDWTLSAVGDLLKQTVNGTESNRTFDGTHQLIDVDSTTVTYDPKGNRTSNALTLSEWDIDNHMVQAKDAQFAILADYECDALGRRVAKVLANGTRTDFLLNEKDQVCTEYVNNVANNSYCTGSYIDDQVLMVTPTEQFCMHRDRQFNTRAITAGDASVVETYEYTPQGTVDIYDANGLSLTTSSIGNMNTFTGRYFDQETGLYYFRARYFDSELNTFISRDPLGYVDGMSMYVGYFSNGMGVDPTGTAWYNPFSWFSNDDHLKEDGCCKDGEREIEDDAGEMCCPEAIQRVTLYIDVPATGWNSLITLGNLGGSGLEGMDPGHVFLGLGSPPNEEKIGFWPGNDGFLGDGPGAFADEDTSSPTGGPHEYDKVKIFKACPKSIKKLADDIIKDMKNPPNYHLGMGGHQCSSWACEKLENAGFGDHGGFSPFTTGIGAEPKSFGTSTGGGKK